MNAKELTTEYYRLRDDYIETKKQVEYLTEELKKLRMMIADLQIDVRMMQR